MFFFELCCVGLKLTKRRHLLFILPNLQTIPFLVFSSASTFVLVICLFIWIVSNFSNDREILKRQKIYQTRRQIKLLFCLSDKLALHVIKLKTQMIMGLKFSSKARFDYIISHGEKRFYQLKAPNLFQMAKKNFSQFCYLITVHKHLIQFKLNRLVCDLNNNETLHESICAFASIEMNNFFKCEHLHGKKGKSKKLKPCVGVICKKKRSLQKAIPLNTHMCKIPKKGESTPNVRD